MGAVWLWQCNFPTLNTQCQFLNETYSCNKKTKEFETKAPFHCCIYKPSVYIVTSNYSAGRQIRKPGSNRGDVIPKTTKMVFTVTLLGVWHWLRRAMLMIAFHCRNDKIYWNSALLFKFSPYSSVTVWTKATANIPHQCIFTIHWKTWNAKDNNFQDFWNFQDQGFWCEFNMTLYPNFSRWVKYLHSSNFKHHHSLLYYKYIIDHWFEAEWDKRKDTFFRSLQLGLHILMVKSV